MNLRSRATLDILRTQVHVRMVVFCAIEHDITEGSEAEFKGPSRSDVRRDAKAAGWRLFRNRLALCPLHRSKAGKVRKL